MFNLRSHGLVNRSTIGCIANLLCTEFRGHHTNLFAFSAFPLYVTIRYRVRRAHHNVLPHIHSTNKKQPQPCSQFSNIKCLAVGAHGAPYNLCPSLIPSHRNILYIICLLLNQCVKNLLYTGCSKMVRCKTRDVMRNKAYSSVRHNDK